MKATTRVALVATIGLTSAVHAQDFKDFMGEVFAQTNHTPIPILDWRARYEYGNQENLDSGSAGTLRGRVGLKSQDYNGFSGLVEFEATRALNTDSYNAAGVHGDPAKTVIADPESTELNRIQLQFKKNDNLLIGGRQRIILDNARYVGNVGWRQNEQTYDAVTYKNTMIKDLSLYYGYIDRVQRIFGSDAPPNGGNAKQWDSDSHLFNIGYSGLEGHKFTGYAYLLQFDNDAVAAGNSSDTFGLNYTFKGNVASDYALTAYGEFAYQKSNSNNPLTYEAPYLHFFGTMGREGYSATIGYEMLGSDDGIIGFRTPLATAHKFNGWNDQFLVTPANGLHDIYAGIGVPVPKVPMKLIYHYFASDTGGISFGHEIDYLASYKISPKMKTVAKASYYMSSNESTGASNFDRLRFSVQLDYKY